MPQEVPNFLAGLPEDALNPALRDMAFNSEEKAAFKRIANALLAFNYVMQDINPQSRWSFLWPGRRQALARACIAINRDLLDNTLVLAKQIREKTKEIAG